MMLSFASCQKDEVPATSNDEMMVVCEFDGDLKTTLNADGKTPEWAVGDKIRILGSTTYTDKTLTAAMIQDGKIYFTIPTSTAYQGDVYAVYPASATTLTKCEDGNITLSIPASQDGTFAKANICVAKGVRGEGNYVQLIFRNATSVLAFSQTAATTGVKYVNVKAANAIAGTITASFGEEGDMVTITPSGLTDKKIIVNASTAQDNYYIAVAPVATGNVQFVYGKTPLTISNVKMKSTTLARNKIYACPTMDGREYKIQTGTIGGHNYVQVGDIKWATNNVAITESGNKVFKSLKTPLTGEDVVNGDYFQWAAHEGYCGNSTDADKGLLIYESFTSTMCGDASDAFTFKIKTGTTKYQFNASGISPYYNTNTSKYTKYTSYPATLESADDVASICWGGTWRMATIAEFKALYDCTKWTWNGTDKGYYLTEKGVTLASDKSNAIMFFPAAGYGYNKGFNNVGVYGRYWSSSISSTTSNAHNLYTTSSEVSAQSTNARIFGIPIRPVSD